MNLENLRTTAVNVPREGGVIVINNSYALEWSRNRRAKKQSSSGVKLCITAADSIAIQSEDLVAKAGLRMSPFCEGTISSMYFRTSKGSWGQRILIGNDLLTVRGKSDEFIRVEIRSFRETVHEVYADQDPKMLMWHIGNITNTIK